MQPNYAKPVSIDKLQLVEIRQMSYSSHHSWTPVVNSAVEAYEEKDFELVQDLINILFKGLAGDAASGELDYVLVAGLGPHRQMLHPGQPL